MSESAALGPPGPSASVVEQLACTPTLARPPSSAAGDPPPAMAGVAAPAHALVTIIPAAEVPAEYKATAAAWPIWDSKTHPQKPKGSGKFPFDYNGDYATERVLITAGRATLTPSDGEPPLTIGKGDAVYFHRGFKCDWHVHERMTKHYAYYGDDGEPMPEPPGISCDLCSGDCYAESYLFTAADGTEMDLCPRCYKKDKVKYAGAERQREGEAVPEPAAKKPKKS